MLKRICAVTILSAVGMMLGCRAEGEVDPHGTSNTTVSNDGSSYSKKTTEVKSPDGSYQKTEKTAKNP